MFNKNFQLFLILFTHLVILSNPMLVFGMHGVTDDDVSVFLRVPPCSMKGVSGVSRGAHMNG